MKNNFFIVLLLIGFLTSCTAEQEPINFGKDACAHCKMVISDEKFGGEIVTKTGKLFKFDSAECLVDYLSEEASNINDASPQLFVINYARPGVFLEARASYYLKDNKINSPMAGNLAVFNTKMLAENNKLSPGATVMSWAELVNSRK